MLDPPLRIMRDLNWRDDIQVPPEVRRHDRRFRQPHVIIAWRGFTKARAERMGLDVDAVIRFFNSDVAAGTAADAACCNALFECAEDRR